MVHPSHRRWRRCNRSFELTSWDTGVAAGETTVNDGGMATKLSDRGRVAWQEWFAEQGGWTKALESVWLRG
jgi:hypothetical protein